ncbi:MAG: hypothetical protein AB7I08_08540 [Thermoleophilia bacterium]
MIVAGVAVILAGRSAGAADRSADAAERSAVASEEAVAVARRALEEDLARRERAGKARLVVEVGSALFSAFNMKLYGYVRITGAVPAEKARAHGARVNGEPAIPLDVDLGTIRVDIERTIEVPLEERHKKALRFDLELDLAWIDETGAHRAWHTAERRSRPG